MIIAISNREAGGSTTSAANQAERPTNCWVSFHGARPTFFNQLAKLSGPPKPDLGHPQKDLGPTPQAGLIQTWPNNR